MLLTRSLLSVMFSTACVGFSVWPRRHHRGRIDVSHTTFSKTLVRGSFFEDLFSGLTNATANSNKELISEEFLANVNTEEGKQQEEDSLSLAAFQAQVEKQKQTAASNEDFDGYAMRDAILTKWGQCFDMDFQPVDAFGHRELYLNVMPFRLGTRSFRHETELDYLCHLQAVVEILQKYNQLDYVLYQIDETKKKPRAGTSPLIAVPLRLDLTPGQVNSILGYR